jgi:hypothetical protein
MAYMFSFDVNPPHGAHVIWDHIWKEDWGHYANGGMEMMGRPANPELAPNPGTSKISANASRASPIKTPSGP